MQRTSQSKSQWQQLFLHLLSKPSSTILLRSSFSNPNLFIPSHNLSSSSPPPSPSPSPSKLLTPDELKKINLLLPRLCESNNLHQAIRLIDTVLLTNPPLQSISLSVLIDRLSSEPDMTQSMALLNRLKHNPIMSPLHLLHIIRMLIISYLKKRRCKEAIKVLNWASRSDSPCAPDTPIYQIVVRGLCRNSMTFEALKVVKGMLAQIRFHNVSNDHFIRDSVCRGLLREARVRESQELNEAFLNYTSEEGGLHKVLDQIIDNWTD